MLNKNEGQDKYAFDGGTKKAREWKKQKQGKKKNGTNKQDYDFLNEFKEQQRSFFIPHFFVEKWS